MSSIESIELNVRSYRSALKSSLEITVNSLTNSHLKMESILHPYGNNPDIVDISTLVYTLLRLPSTLDKTKLVVMGQSPEVFENGGYPNVTSWPKCPPTARRRVRYFNPSIHILAEIISSISDVDDVVNSIVAYQTEWNKLHHLLKLHYPHLHDLKKAIHSKNIINTLKITPKDWQKLCLALGKNHSLRFARIYHLHHNLRLRLLAGSWIDYTKTTQHWWKNITLGSPKLLAEAAHCPVYFISSNTHSLLNLVTGQAVSHQKELLKLAQNHHPDLDNLWQNIQTSESFLHQNDFLYYLSKYMVDNQKYQQDWQKLQNKLDILSIPPTHFLNSTLQIFPVASLSKSKFLDSRLKITNAPKLQRATALIINIDYPLGFAAYHVLSEVLENINDIRGVYILGKAAVLNSEIGDIQIPRLTFDEHTQNSYIYKNCFNSFFPFPNNQGSILTNQKSVSVLGTFLENQALIDKYSENNLTVIEMETGPYLNAITESCYDLQTPRGTIVDLNSAPFDLGVINYSSDTPYSQAKNLGAGSLNLSGLEPVYLGSLAILQRIINLEESK
ncbi:hypothetical protein COZ41_02445 [Candidatus Shapirobacteria bacterium CG_4_10_14_3_um_filter_35_13]|uniref:Uncharacterized protein n=4 Tax=Candidatus Shapironibacteriota TaxID=1752721 RepID=A0A2M7LIM6_9BACT|nr:MAG: hypothetical protein COZ41_02445 [Candidatus Shapirobacteria bacterium CG_4_10_14_3_um_filter_35_13]